MLFHNKENNYNLQPSIENLPILAKHNTIFF